MVQKISPFVETKYGWDFGESGWNSGMDENLIKHSFLLDKNLDGVVSSLPLTPTDGSAYFLQTDSRVYLRVGGSWYSTPIPKNATLFLKGATGSYVFNGTSLELSRTLKDISDSVDGINATISSLGSAAYQDSTDFATDADLDIVAAQSQSYTDSLRTDLSDSAPGKGTALVFGATRRVSDLTALAATDPSYGTVEVSYRVGNTGGGVFRFISGDQSANVSSDPGGGVWVAPASDISGTSGAWRRLYDGPLRAEWWGVVSNGADVSDQAIAFVTYCIEKSIAGEFPSGTFLISKSMPFPHETSIVGQGQSTIFHCSLPTGAYLFDRPSTYARSYTLGRFRVTNAVYETRRDFGVVRLWGTLRKGLIEDIVCNNLHSPYFFDTNQWGQLSLKRICVYNFDGSNVIPGSVGLNYKGNTMFAEDIEILGTFEQGLIFSGRCFKLNGFNIGGSQTDYMRKGLLINGSGDGVISAGWIEQLDPTLPNGTARSIEVSGAKNVVIQGVDIAAGSIFYTNGATGDVSSVTYGHANGGMRVESGSKVTIAQSALKFQEPTDSPAFPIVVGGNETGLGLNATPTFTGADPMTNTNNTVVTVTDETGDFLTGGRARLVTTTAAFNGRRFTATIPKAGEVYTVVARVKRLSSGRISITAEATTVIDGSGFNIGRTTTNDWELFITTVRSTSTSLQVRIIAETAGTFLIDSFNVFKGLSTFDPKNYV